MTSDAPEIEAFVIMPFAQEMRRNYDLVIGPALRRGKVRPIRADEEQSGHIHAQMLSRILESGLTVADISGTNPNVFYELGVAHSLRSRTLMVVREDCAKTIPFDVMPYRVFIFKDPAVATNEEIEADIVRLAEEISRIARDANLAVPNPVQAFLAERSAVDSPRSVYLPSLSSADQEKAIVAARKEIAFIGLSSSSCVKPVLEMVEAGLHPAPLHLRLGILSKECLDGWRFVFNLREGRSGSDEEIEELRSDSAEYQNGWIKRMDRLAKRCPHFTFQVSRIPLPIHFWAFMFDEERIFVGYLAWNKESATGMPVTVLVKSDPATKLQFDYYQGTIESLLKSGMTQTV